MLAQTSQFIETIPDSLEISANQQKIIITDKITTSNIHIQEGTKLTFITLLKKGWQETQKLNFHLEGKGAEVTFLSFILGKQEEEFPFETISNHKVPETNAYYYIRSALFDNSQVRYRGSLNIKPKAQITDAYLGHHTLMLSKDAHTETIPSLEIEADDVKAGHAATIGQVDDDMLYYLGTRGINKQQGKDMLIKGFMEADLKKIPNEEVQKILIEEIESELTKQQ